MIDIVRQIVRPARGRQRAHGGREGHTVRLRRTYEAALDDVWDALTNPERIGRWFLPVSGDYRVGGRYQLEGNAGGEIVACERPHLLRVTWVYGEATNAADASVVEVRLTSAGESATVLELEHTAVVPEEMWDTYGPGAVGVGWDGAMLGLALHFVGERPGDPMAWQLSEEGRAFSALSSAAWGRASVAGGADPEAVARAVANTTAFYAPPPDAAS